MWRYFQRLFLGKSTKEKGWITKLNNTWTPVILLTLSILSLLLRYTEKPVDCWCPAEFKPSMVQYTNNICWRSESVYLPMEKEIPSRMDPIYVTPLNKWIPLLFILQAILFKLPGIIMHVGESKIGFKRNKLYGLTDGYTNLSLDDRRDVGKQLSRYLSQWLKNRLITGIPFGLLTFLYAFVYMLYVVNITVQITVIDKYIKHPNVSSYGTHLTRNFFTNKSFPIIQSPAFLNIFLCDFKIRKLQTVQHFTVQCISNIDMVNEQIFAFLWIWLVFTTVVTYCSFALKVVEVIIPVFRTRYIKQYLYSENALVHNESDVSRFANTILGEDGVIVLKGIGDVSSEYIVRDAVINLWISHFGDRGVLQQINPAMQTLTQRDVEIQGYEQGSGVSAFRDDSKEAESVVELEKKS